jgi:hypothetical protein
MKTAKNLGLGLVCLVLASAALPAHSHAQVRFLATAGPGVFGGDGPVTKRSVERYSELLGFTPEQKDSAFTVFDGYSSAYQDAQKLRRSAMDDIRRSSEDTGDHTVFMEKAPKVESEFRSTAQRLEKSLFDDLKALVSPSQESTWPKVERMRRREVELKRGTLSGESVDLTEVIAGLKLSPDAMAPLAAPLDEYENELDHQLQAKAKAQADAPKFEPGKPMDIEAMKKQMAESQEAGMKVKEVNERTARKLEPLLPEDKRAAFKDAVRQRSFPQVYRTSHATKDIEAAIKLSDLTGSQRSQLADLKASYERQASPLNDAWAAAIQSSEASGQSGMTVDGMGGRMVLNVGDDPPALTDARKARRELDDATNEKLKGILTETQRDKLQRARTAETEDDAIGTFRSIMIRNEDR